MSRFVGLPSFLAGLLPENWIQLKARDAGVFLRGIVVGILVAWATLPAVAEAQGLLEPRKFTDAEGRTLVAAIVGLDANSVKMKQVDGVMFTLPLARLSVTDQQYIEEQRKALEEELRPLPETEFTRLLRANFVVLNPSGTGTMSPPEELWTRTRRFLVLANYTDGYFLREPDILDWLHHLPEDVAVVAIMSKTLREPTLALKFLNALPAGTALLKQDSLRQDIDKAGKIQWQIIMRETERDTNRFHRLVATASPEKRAAWADEIRAGMPAYWPVPVDPYRQMGFGQFPELFLCDREGKGLNVSVGQDIKARSELLSFPARPVVKRGALVETGVLRVPRTLHPLKLHNAGGKPFDAYLVSVSDDTLSIAPKEANYGGSFRFYSVELSKLHPLDRETVEKLKTHPNVRESRRVTPLQTMEFSDLERQRAKRFVVDLVYSKDESGTSIWRWPAMPTLVVESQEGMEELKDLAWQTYDSYCAATGLPDRPDPYTRINLLIGDVDYVNKTLRQTGRKGEKKVHSSWVYSDDGRGNTSVDVQLVINKTAMEDEKRYLVNAMGEFFRVLGSSKVFKESRFGSYQPGEPLTPIDQYFLRFYYTSVPVGTTREQLFKIVENQWGKPLAK